jgi:hypothetical protein
VWDYPGEIKRPSADALKISDETIYISNHIGVGPFSRLISCLQFLIDIESQHFFNRKV